MSSDENILVCYETQRKVENPFHTIMAVLRNPESRMVAYSAVELPLCNEAHARVEGSLHRNPEDLDGIFGYAVETNSGMVSESFGFIRVCLPIQGRRDYQYLDEAVAAAYLPRSAETLKRDVNWMEHTNGRWQKAEWAAAVYAMLQNVN